MLVGRDIECRRIDRLLEDAREHRGAALVIRGDPGIGKSALLRYAERHAKGMHVLRATGTESDSELRFAALTELLLPLLDVIETLPQAQRAALLAAFAIGSVVPPSHLELQTATLAALAKAADGRPTLCLIDDAHWLDPVSYTHLTLPTNSCRGHSCAHRRARVRTEEFRGTRSCRSHARRLEG